MGTETARQRLGTRIRTERERLGWTQARLADEATAASGGQVTLARSTLARQESGEREPGVLEAVYIAQALGVPLAALVAPDDDDLNLRSTRLLAEHRALEDHLSDLANQHNLTIAQMKTIEAQADALVLEGKRRGIDLSALTDALDPWMREQV
jgi:transcriptional regulator with XRE-family HTH domain